MATRLLFANARQLRSSSLSDLIGLFNDWVYLPKDLTRPLRDRVFSTWRTFWLFLSQVLSSSHTCRETVRKAQAWLFLEQGKELSPNTSAYCQARKRLPQTGLNKAQEHIVEKLEAQVRPSHLWHGRQVKIVDGSSVSMPDTPSNQKSFPQPNGQKPGCGFPVMRLIGLFSLATGSLLTMRTGPLHDHEQTLWRKLWDMLTPGDVALGDRGFCSYANFWLLGQRCVDSITQLHQARSVGLRIVKRLGKRDHLVEWTKSKAGPKWMSKQQWNQIPFTLKVRHITFSVTITGFRTKVVTVATALLDPKTFPTHSFVELYRQRWLAELFLRDLKTSMGMEVLRCKTPVLVHKELTMHAITYNLVRALMWESARNYHIDLFRLSFMGALATIRQWSPLLASLTSKVARRNMINALLKCLARDLLPVRPGRVEPRAVKRRPKPYQLLTKPRRQFRETIHRGKYSKVLS
jgi:hypothetical protein